MSEMPSPPDDGEPTIADELAAVPHEPLLPIEKKLIIGSLVTGVILLAVLVWISITYFPVTAAP
jgi:hypothetical protein